MMLSTVLLPSDQQATFSACLTLPCYSSYLGSTFVNVSWTYFADDPLSGRKLMLKDTQLLPEGSSTANYKALVVDGTNAWGGYTEDIAKNALAIGYDILVIQEYGDDEYNCGFGAEFTISRECPIPVFKIASTSQELVRTAQFVTLKTATVWESTRINARILGVVEVLAGFAVVGISFHRLIALGAPKTFNVGVMVCYCSLLVSIFMLSGSNQMLSGFDSKVHTNFVWFIVHIGLIGIWSLIPTYLIGLQFDRTLLQAQGEDASLKRPRVVLASAFVAFVCVYIFIASFVIAFQVFGFSWVFTASYLLFCGTRVYLACYFVWSYLKIANVVNASRSLVASSRETVFMSKKLLPIGISSALCVAISLAIALKGINNFHGNAVILGSLLNIFTCCSLFLEVTALSVRSRNSRLMALRARLHSCRCCPSFIMDLMAPTSVNTPHKSEDRAPASGSSAMEMKQPDSP
eukprot:TRINITY_DN36177_c0_g1_i1.p1 TRINITY_DN36177_c0_g1~~TRINITY_DN36177_c0_g1_i1.p1  ORF type:complete len:463 (+),score=86.49 TRINITY_DN36177_c0_g1_i1:67-1455(+)